MVLKGKPFIFVIRTHDAEKINGLQDGFRKELQTGMP
jgi:hypothetical protein